MEFSFISTCFISILDNV